MENYIVAFAVIAISAALILIMHGLITVIINNKRVSIESLINEDIYRRAFAETTSGLFRGEIYTKKGAVRANIQKQVFKNLHKINNEEQHLLSGFIDHMRQSELVDKNDRVAYKYKTQVISEYDRFKRSYRHKRNNCSDSYIWISPEHFFQKKSSSSGDIVGVYVIHNTDKGMYYVGQSKRIYFRVNQHFTGHGNGDVYADYKNGDNFRITLLPLFKDRKSVV